MKLKYAIIFSLLLMANAYSKPMKAEIPAVHVATMVNNFEHNKNAFIQLKRNACSDFCPIYELTIYGDGRVVYKGEQFVMAIGEKTSKLSSGQLKELVAAIKNAHLMTIKTLDLDSEPIRKNDPFIITLVGSGLAKTISTCSGLFCDDYTKQYILADRIDQIAYSVQWVGKEGMAIIADKQKKFRKMKYISSLNAIYSYLKTAIKYGQLTLAKEKKIMTLIKSNVPINDFAEALDVMHVGDYKNTLLKEYRCLYEARLVSP